MEVVMYKFRMGGCLIECESLEVFQNLLEVVMNHCDENLAPPRLATMVSYRGVYADQKINQIKVVREITGLGLAEAKCWVEGQSVRMTKGQITKLIGAGFQVKS